MQKTVIIVAGGQGLRFNQEMPKQFFYIGERPLLVHTIDLFHRYSRDMEIIVGIPENFMLQWESFREQFAFDVPHSISPGGETRFHTVKNALGMVTPGNLVAIHDAVRPLLYRSTIDDCFEAAEKTGAALPCVEINDSVREITRKGSRPLNRDTIRLVQTPQVFQYDILVKGYMQEYSVKFTDDASVVEKAGFPVTLVRGNPENIKITTPEDLNFADVVFDAYKKKSGLF
ncbi:2-C-methyl-D-erythritol 4-phosphate cytidylyltransferase [Bacteroidota bacterium]